MATAAMNDNRAVEVGRVLEYEKLGANAHLGKANWQAGASVPYGSTGTDPMADTVSIEDEIGTKNI